MFIKLKLTNDLSGTSSLQGINEETQEVEPSQGMKLEFN
jgi:hypothetical protein